MTYPQPRTSDQITAGAKQFRFLTQVGAINVGAGIQSAGAGEIYEIDSGFTAIAYGPDMDFANLQLTYFDPSSAAISPTAIGTVRLTPDAGFPGALGPRFDQTYPISPGRKGRMLVSLLDLWSGTYTPVGFSAGGQDEIFFIKPTIDLVGWQSTPPTLPTKRSDKVFLFQSYAKTLSRNYWIIVPYYQRKYAWIDYLNKSGASISIEVRGVNLSTVNVNWDGAAAPALHEETQLLVATPVANGAHQTKIVRAAVDGEFDLLAIALDFNGSIANCPLRINVSDDPL